MIPAGADRLPRDVAVLAVIAFFVMLGFGVVIPVLPVYVRSFGVGYIEVGAVVSAFALMRLLASPGAGWLLTRGGERTILAVGIGVVAISSGLVGLAQNFEQVLVLRAVGGIGSAMFTIAAMSLLLRTTPAHLRGRAMSLYQGGFLIGGMAGPALGGVLAVISLQAPFFFYAAMLAVAGVVGLLLLHAPDAGSALPTKVAPMPLREAFGDVRFVAACVANLAQGWASMGVRSAFVPALVVEVLFQEELWTGVAFAIAAVAQTLTLVPAGRLVDTVGRRPILVGSYALAAVSMAIIPFSPNLIVLIIALCLYAVAAAFMGTAPAATVGDVTAGRTGQPVAVFSAFSDVGAIIGPLIAGYLADTVSLTAAFASAVVILALSAVISAAIRPRKVNLGSNSVNT